MGDPSISTVIPAYNAEAWIAQTLESVFEQTSPPDEVIVVDDGSTDATQAQLQPFLDHLLLIEQANAGCGSAFNAGIMAASGTFVALCPADDIWTPDKLARQRCTLTRHPEVDVSFGAARNFGLHDSPFPRPERPGVQDRDAFTQEMFEQNVIPDPSVVVRRELVLRLGGFVAAVGEDYEFWMRALRFGATFHFDEHELVRLRQHGGNLSAQALAIHNMNLAVHRAAKAAIADKRRVAAVLSRDLTAIGRCHAGLGQAKEARVAFRQAFQERPSATAAVGTVALSVPGAGRLLQALYAARSG